MKSPAKMMRCTEHMSEIEHMNMDHCSACAPFWDKFPICPMHNKKLTKTGYCGKCRKHYDISMIG